ncbi:hypothetical protein BDZ89DRAFT_1077462 [Hymenopellis radicata]|nr:hypothetical protein BDZ89DRAFT_1077462 [Hymenopellis radicata]
MNPSFSGRICPATRWVPLLCVHTVIVSMGCTSLRAPRPGLKHASLTFAYLPSRSLFNTKCTAKHVFILLNNDLT